MELFFANLLLGTNNELKNRFIYVVFVDENISQSATYEIPKCQFGTLDCTLEELALLELITKNLNAKQQELSMCFIKKLDKMVI